MWPIKTIVLALASAVSGILSVAEIALIELFSNKKTLFTGPLSSGKTTFLRYIAKEKIPDEASGAPKRYKVKNAMFDEVTDFSGAEAWLKSKFNDYIKEHDYILFFFDISEYIKDTKYRADSNARIDMIHRNSTSSQKVLIVGTHVDKLHGNYQAEIEKFFAGKPYQSVLNRVVYIDTTKKECVETVLNELKK
jgi:dephospho-CoA kinase